MHRTRATLDAARGNRDARSIGRLAVIFAPILALLAATALLAMAAWVFGWYQPEMHRAAEILAGIAGLLAMILLYRQIRQREAANRALQSLSARVGNIVEAAMDPIITVAER